VSNTQPDTAPATEPASEPAAVPDTFRDLGVIPEIASALEAAGIIHPFPIQAMTLPMALLGTDVIGQARTGTGKTLAFAVPIVQRLVAPGDQDFVELTAPGAPQALVIAPTRELALQVTGDVQVAASRRGMRVLPVYGGRAYEPQIEALRRGVEVVVGTPGRLLDLAQQGHLDLGHVKVLVLDEADEMLDLGFLPDVERLLARTPELRQTMLFSATMPGAVIQLARRYMRTPTNIRAESPDETVTVPLTAQYVYRAHAMDKVEMLTRILQADSRGLTIVFCRTKRTAANVAENLADRGFAAAAVHGDLGQGAREQALRAFRNGKVDVLVATDVAARGIDVQDVTHVINYQCPEDEKTYLHRIGRTGRAGASGVAITFVDWDDIPRWALINKALDLPFDSPPETYSNSEHLYHDLGIPREATGVLPRTRRTRAGLAAEQVEDVGETGRHARSAAGRSQGRDSRSDARESRSEPVQERAREEDKRPRRTLSRQRTRAGQAVAEATTTSGTGTATDVATPAAGATDGEAGAPRRRRRGGRGRGRSSTGATGPTGEATGGTEATGAAGTS